MSTYPTSSLVSSVQPHAKRSHCRPPPHHRQQGVVLIFSLIALTIMLIGAVALVSSFNTSLISAGNNSFKRDFQNRAELVNAAILQIFTVPGQALDTPLKRSAHISSANYSAVQLPTNAQGIPTALLQKQSDFMSGAPATTPPAPAAIPWTRPDIVVGGGITARYLVDRLCTETGNAAVLSDKGTCTPCSTSWQGGGDESHVNTSTAAVADTQKAIQGTGYKPVVYRITTRLMGPRDTQAFYQTTFCEPL